MHWSGRLGSRLGHGAAYTGLVPWKKNNNNNTRVCVYPALLNTDLRRTNRHSLKSQGGERGEDR